MIPQWGDQGSERSRFMDDESGLNGGGSSVIHGSLGAIDRDFNYIYIKGGNREAGDGSQKEKETMIYKKQEERF